MANTTLTCDLYRVACGDWAQTFRSIGAAQRRLVRIESGSEACRELHTIEVRGGDGWVPLHIAKARRILATKLGAVVDSLDGALVVSTVGWSAETAQRPEVRAAQALDDHAAFVAALGPYDHAVLTADGRGARYDGWCACERHPAAMTWVRYERWSGRGREAHGYLCPECRFLVQAG